MWNIYDYNLSFEVGDKRIKAQQSGYNIYDVIKKIRKDYPDAHMFVVLRKIKNSSPI